MSQTPSRAAKNVFVRASHTVIKKGNLHISNDLSQEFSSYWVTMEDLWRRMLHVGAQKSLTLEFVHNALQRNDNNQSFLKVLVYNGAQFFWSAISNTDETTLSYFLANG